MQHRPETSRFRTAGVLAGLLACTLVSGPTRAVDENLLAWRLLQAGEPTQAAELFTDPAWKGVAFYRSGQWWRAAEAFVRADDAISAYNLGNAYVKLGYYALALEAYQRALSLEPTLADAEANAVLMRKLLALDGDDQQQGGRQLANEEIDRIESDDSARSSSESQGSEDTDEQAPGEAEQRSGESSADQQGQAGDRGNGGDEEGSRRENRSRRNDVEGRDTSSDAELSAGGGAESPGSRLDEPIGGQRSELSSEQATEQWLNRIQHDPVKYLKRRIQLETRRRAASGQTAPEGGSAW